MIRAKKSGWYVIPTALSNQPWRKEKKIYVSIISIMQTNIRNFVIPSGFVSLSITMSCVDTQLKMIDKFPTSSRDL